MKFFQYFLTKTLGGKFRKFNQNLLIIRELTHAGGDTHMSSAIKQLFQVAHDLSLSLKINQNGELQSACLCIRLLVRPHIIVSCQLKPFSWFRLNIRFDVWNTNYQPKFNFGLYLLVDLLLCVQLKSKFTCICFLKIGLSRKNN